MNKNMIWPFYIQFHPIELFSRQSNNITIESTRVAAEKLKNPKKARNKTQFIIQTQCISIVRASNKKKITRITTSELPEAQPIYTQKEYNIGSHLNETTIIANIKNTTKKCLMFFSSLSARDIHFKTILKILAAYFGLVSPHNIL